MRVVVSISLALLLGLLAARMPSIAEADPSFSWFGFVGGVAVISLAAGIGRVLAPTAADTTSRFGSPLQQWLVRSALSCLLLALVSFVLLLYTPWQWPRYLATVVVAVGVVAVFIGVASAWFGGKREA
jgi:MFS superfamily sulfate permease-like transporter